MATLVDRRSTAQRPVSGQELRQLLILSMVAGIVDVTGFLRLDHVFTAHITGNLVVMADQVVNGGPPHVAQLLSIPVFAAAVVLAYFLAGRGRPTDGGRARRANPATHRGLLSGLRGGCSSRRSTWALGVGDSRAAVTGRAPDRTACPR